MVPMNILHYVQGPHALVALDAGFEFAEREMNWLTSDRAQIYQISALAFGPVPDFISFRRIYDWMVSYWKINRGGGLAPAENVFAMLIAGCTATSRHAGSTLLNSDNQAIQAAIRAMSRVKANSEYPHMAAAKFLHFYNPSLFPIYDDAVMWKRVLNGAFRREWAAVCDEYGIKVWEPSEKFLITYCSWAAEVMRAADPEVMVEFERRFRELEGQDAVTLGGTQRYHATAFEYLLIGAARLNGSGGIASL